MKKQRHKILLPAQDTRPAPGVPIIMMHSPQITDDDVAFFVDIARAAITLSPMQRRVLSLMFEKDLTVEQAADLLRRKQPSISRDREIVSAKLKAVM